MGKYRGICYTIHPAWKLREPTQSILLSSVEIIYLSYKGVRSSLILNLCNSPSHQLSPILKASSKSGSHKISNTLLGHLKSRITMFTNFHRREANQIRAPKVYAHVFKLFVPSPSRL